MNRQQQYMHRALADIREIQNDPAADGKGFGQLSHQLPAIVLNNGLAVTFAYLQAKKKADNDRFGLALRSVCRLLGLNAQLNPSDLNKRFVDRGSEQYMIDTFTILDAWIFYKRFAVSLLDVESAGDGVDAPLAAPVAIGEEPGNA